jgi:hypothetical protein
LALPRPHFGITSASNGKCNSGGKRAGLQLISFPGMKHRYAFSEGTKLKSKDLGLGFMFSRASFEGCVMAPNQLAAGAGGVSTVAEPQPHETCLVYSSHATNIVFGRP